MRRLDSIHRARILWIPFRSLISHLHLVISMAQRDVLGRYRGSTLGVIWSFMNPLILLLIYAFVFGIVFQNKWGVSTNVNGEFVANLFLGLMIYTAFSEILNRSPLLIINNTNYVKKIVFPLDVLPWSVLASSLFHLIVSLCLLFLFSLASGVELHWAGLLLPVLFLPFILVLMGFSWFFASLGVFIRDIDQVISLVTTAAMFLAPVFFPLSAVPLAYRPFFFINPLTWEIEAIRNLLFHGKLPSVLSATVYSMAALVVFFLGYSVFTRLRRGFADVL